jgi:N-acetylglutamate synthase-like GNAT family acetyltransferase
MDIKIGRAGKEDFSYIQEKIKKYLLDATNIDWAQFFVARTKDKIVSFGRIIEHGDFFEIASLGVDYYYRKKGIGKIMLNYLVRKAWQMDGQKPIYGVTHLERFLRACGFVRVANNYPDYLDYKRRCICRLDKSRINIMKWAGALHPEGLG